MPKRVCSGTVLALLHAAALSFLAGAQAQDYPAKPIWIVVPFPPGGGVDRMARLAAEKLRDRWGQPVIVENRPGAAGNIGAEHVANARPDGYTILYGVPQTYVINKLLFSKLSYDPDRFVPISVLITAPNVLIVHPKVGAESLQDLIALAKASPGRLNYASPGSGSTMQLTAELIKLTAGVSIVHIPYNGTSPALADLLAGQVDMLITELGNAIPHVRSGKLRALAVGSEKRNSLFPTIPTMSEVLPGVISTTWAGMAAPPATPAAIVNRLAEAFAEMMKQPDIKKYVVANSIEAVGGTPAEMALLIRQERERWGNVVRRTGAKAD